jgi:hypothetical protein
MNSFYFVIYYLENLFTILFTIYLFIYLFYLLIYFNSEGKRYCNCLEQGYKLTMIILLSLNIYVLH